MNKLELVNRLARNCGYSQPIDRLEGVGGIVSFFSDWIDDAWRDLQNAPGWRWMRGTAVGFAGPGSAFIPWAQCWDRDRGERIARFNSWRTGEGEIGSLPRIVRVSEDDLGEDSLPLAPETLLSKSYGVEQVLAFFSWDGWRNYYDRGIDAVGHPSAYAVNPLNALSLGPRPGEGQCYRVSLDYYRGPQVLEDDEAVPEMPEQFHMLIVYDAMLHYAYDRVAQEVLESSMSFSRQMRDQLDAVQADPIEFAGPLI